MQKLTSGFDPGINKIGSYAPKALPTTPRMLELTAEPLNYDKITKFRNLYGATKHGSDYLVLGRDGIPSEEPEDGSEPSS